MKPNIRKARKINWWNDKNMKQQKQNQKDKQNTKVVQQSSVITSDKLINCCVCKRKVIDDTLYVCNECSLTLENRIKFHARKELIEEFEKMINDIFSTKYGYIVNEIQKEILQELNKLKEKKE